MDLINFLILIVSIFALGVSVYSWRLSQHTYSLSLFNNRFNLYHQLNIILSELLNIIPSESGSDILFYKRMLKCHDIDRLTFESKYLFGNEIEQILIKISNQIYPIPSNKKIMDNDLKIILQDLLGKDTNKNLDSYFSKYLYHPSFKNPIKKMFFIN